MERPIKRATHFAVGVNFPIFESGNEQWLHQQISINDILTQPHSSFHPNGSLKRKILATKKELELCIAQIQNKQSFFTAFNEEHIYPHIRCNILIC